MTYIGGYYGNKDYSGNVSIPSTIVYEEVPYDVTSIGSYAFYGCSELTSLTIPSSVTSIGAYALYNCTGLTSVTIPESVSAIGGHAFYGCTGLTSVTIPSNVTIIGFEAFRGCTGLTSITIPSSVTRIDQHAFLGCSGLTSLTILEGVSSIGISAFDNCTSLTSVTIPSSVTFINRSAFSTCHSLTSIIIEGKPSIGEYAFEHCLELLDVYCYSETPPSVSANNSSFSHSHNDYVTLHVPAKALSAYSNDSFWGNIFKEIVTIEPIEYPTSIALSDGETFEGYPSNHDMESITYARTFSNTNWQGLYVPFTMEYSEWAADFDVACIYDIHQFDDDDNGTIDRTELEVIKVTSGSIEANTPYLIRAKEAGEKTFTLANRTLYKAEEKSYTVSSWNTLFTFTGTYSGVTGSDMVSNAYYALGDGVLRQAASTDNALSPYRWYVAITDRNGAQKGVNEVKLKVWGEDATGLSPLSVSPEGEKTAVYDLSGRRVEKATKGLYIVNGKKMMVR